MRAVVRLSSLLLTLILVLPIAAVEPKGGPEAYKRLQFRNIGPAVGGRVCRACGVPGQPLIYYAATAAGGVWKSIDGGVRWKPIMDDMPVSSIGSIAVAPSDPNVIYVGTGEANIRGNVEVGNGIYKSTDAGKTWMHVWKQEGQIGTMIVHPTNPDIAFAAVLGKAFGPNPERGIYRTHDGGKTWRRVLHKNEDTGACDVCIDPSNPRILFAGLWQTRRKPWELISGGPGSGLYTSSDGGDNWTQLIPRPTADSSSESEEAKPGTRRCEGLPEGIWGKIGVAIAPSDPKRIYALIEAEKGGLFRSDDGGEKWSRINSNRAIRQRAWYFSTMTVDPRNADIVYFPQVPLLKSIDGGKSLTRVSGPHHGDHHDLWIDPKNPDRMIDSNDGGVDISTDGGKSWYAPPLPISQVYHLSVDNRTPYQIACTMQDIGTAMGPSRSLGGSEIPLSAWHSVGGGEAGHIAIDPTDPNLVYAGEYGGYISRYNHRTRQAVPISIYPFNPSGYGAESLRYRFQWTAPILLSPHDAKTVYHAANVLFRSRDSGRSWERISDDLSRNDRSKQKWSGGPITGDNTGVEVFGTIFAVAESPIKKGLIWAGTDDGRIHRFDGKSWVDVTPRGIPELGTVTCIEPSIFDPNTAYIVIDAHRIDDRRPYLLITSDQGKNWKSLTSKMPDIGYLQVVREDPRRKGQLYVGGECGLIYSTDHGNNWEQLKLNLPSVRVTDLKVKDDDLVVGTNGRSIWILDDLTPLRNPPAAWKHLDSYLFSPSPAYRFRSAGSPRRSQPMSGGENPPYGALISYSIGNKPPKEITLEILDEGGQVIRKFSSKKPPEPDAPDLGAYSAETQKDSRLPTQTGLHRINWDLQYEGATLIRGARVDMGNARSGPLALPGTYTIRLTADGSSSTSKLRVSPDPRLEQHKVLLDGELESQLRFALSIRDDVTSLTRDVEALRAIRKQLVDRNELLENQKNATELIQGSKRLLKRLDELEDQFHNPRAEVAYDILAQKGGAKLYSQLIWLYELVRDADAVPSQGLREVYSEQSKLLKKLRSDWKTILQDLRRFNEQAQAQGASIIVLPQNKE